MLTFKILDKLPCLVSDDILLLERQTGYGCMVSDYHPAVCLHSLVDGLSLRLELCSLSTCGSLLCLHLL